jgi:hypothetical protein|tara:strand:- start:36 stop:326 length:291 start_codon:yes stop_codon:yes gene_type:complete
MSEKENSGAKLSPLEQLKSYSVTGLSKELRKQLHEKKNMNVCVWDVRFYMNDDDGNELLNDDGSVKLFTAPDLNLDVIVQHVEYGFVSPDDLEEVK